MRKAIAIDFDGCLCQSAWPGIGRPNLKVINAAIREQQNGAALILWTCRVGEKLEAAVEWCKAHGIEFDAVNDNLPERIAVYGANPRKVNADEYWDDLAVQKPTIRAKDTRSQKGRKYFRKCGICGMRHEQNEMVRDGGSPNGWICHACKEDTQ